MAIIKFDSHEITVRESDGFWNATEMVKIFGKRINNFLRNEQTKEYLEALANSRNVDTASVTRISADDLVQLNQGVLGEQGTWVDPEVGLKLAAWLNPRFEVWVFKMIRILLVEGEVKLKDHIQELEMLTDELSNDLALKDYQLNQMKYFVEEADVLGRWQQENSWD
jgi:hypothetical protein